MIIGLLGQSDEPQIQHVGNALKAIGHEPVVFNTALFGTQWYVSFDPHNNNGMLYWQDCALPMSSLYSVYWHKLHLSTACPSNLKEQQSLLQIWLLFANTHWVNSLRAIRNHQCKPLQLAQAAKLGAHIPHTWIGNHAETARCFAEQHTSTIVKPVHGGETTRLVSEHPALNTFSTAHTLQRFIEGTNIRTYVFDDDVCHIRIDTHAIDFRDDLNVTPEKVSGNRAIDAMSVTLCKAFDMRWCAIDWRLTPDGQYVFLEANPAPYFLYAETCTGWDLTGRLLNLLTSAR